MTMFLFENPIREKKVRKDISAYQFRNGTIVINDRQYIQYSMTEAISLFRKQFPLNKRVKK